MVITKTLLNSKILWPDQSRYAAYLLRVQDTDAM